MPSHAHPSLYHNRPFLLYFIGRLFSHFSRQIIAVAVGWQVYEITGSAFHLGMVGLVQFLPTLFLTFNAGHAADRYNRKRIVQYCQWIEGLAAGFLAWGSLSGSITVLDIYIASAVFGGVRRIDSSICNS